MRKLIISASLFFLIGIGQAQECLCLDLETVWKRVIAYDPEVAALETEIAVKEAEMRQVSLRLNPIFAVEGENLGVSHPNAESEPPQTTYSIAQTIELGGKRAARRAFAFSEKGVAFWEAAIARQTLHFACTALFLEVGLAQEKLRLAHERQDIAEKILEAVNIQVQAGKVSPIQENKARIGVKVAQVEKNEFFLQLEQAKKRLSSMWGDSCPDFDSVMFLFDEYTPPPSECELLEAIATTPHFARAQQRIEVATRNLKLQKVNGLPDVTVNAGYRYFNDSHEHGWVVGAEFPLPLFNRNQGNVQRAQLEICQAEYQLEVVVRDLRARVHTLYERWLAAFEASEIMKSEVLPEVAEVFDLTQKGYQKGKIEYLELLDAQKTLFEMQEKYLDVLYEYHLNGAELTALLF